MTPSDPRGAGDRGTGDRATGRRLSNDPKSSPVIERAQKPPAAGRVATISLPTRPTPLTTVRLRELLAVRSGRAGVPLGGIRWNWAVGDLLENAALRSVNLPKYRGPPF